MVDKCLVCLIYSSSSLFRSPRKKPKCTKKKVQNSAAHIGKNVLSYGTSIVLGSITVRVKGKDYTDLSECGRSTLCSFGGGKTVYNLSEEQKLSHQTCPWLISWGPSLCKFKRVVGPGNFWPKRQIKRPLVAKALGSVFCQVC